MAASTALQSVVVDPGGDQLRVGFAGEDGPRSCFPAIVERRPKGMSSTMDLFVGDDAYSKLGILQVARPLQKRSTVDDWGELRKLWHYATNHHARVSPDETGFILCEPPLMAKPDREKMIEMILEDWFQSTYFLLQQTAALFSFGRTVGIILDSGFEVTHCVPICEYAIPHAIRSTEIGGKDVSLKLSELLTKSDAIASDFFGTTRIESKLRRIRDLKHSHCFVKNADTDLSGEVSFELPDGNVIKIPKQLISDATEMMFEDSSKKSDSASAVASSDTSEISDGLMNTMPNIVTETKSKMDEDLFKDHPELAKQLMIVGGNSLINGFSERIGAELGLEKVVALPGRDTVVWIGCSIFSSLSTSAELMVTKQEYQESGKSIVHRKFV